MEKEWDEAVERPVSKRQHDVHEPTTYELAEMELHDQHRYIIKDMMQERYYDYFWDEKHAL